MFEGTADTRVPGPASPHLLLRMASALQLWTSTKAKLPGLGAHPQLSHLLVTSLGSCSSSPGLCSPTPS